MKWKPILLVAVLAVGTFGISSSMAAAGSSPTDRLVAAPDTSNDDEVRAEPAAEPLAITSEPELHFVAVQPCRVVDTRLAVGEFGAGTARSYYVAGTAGFAPQGGKSGGCDIPTGAKAITGTMMVTPSGNGYVRAWPYATSAPNASIMNYDSGRSSTGFTTTVRSGGGKDLWVRNFSSPTHLVIDVTGYFIPQMQAYISSSGSVIDQSGRLVGSSRPSTGTYVLSWDRNVGNCSAQATSDVTGYIMSVYTSSNVTSVRIDTNAGIPANYYFNIVVNC